jgi:hypothetical protein
MLEKARKNANDNDYTNLLPKGSNVVLDDKAKGVVETESTWTGDIKGDNSFPSGLATGSGRSYIHNNGNITISHWEGVFDTQDKEQLTVTQIQEAVVQSNVERIRDK